MGFFNSIFISHSGSLNTKNSRKLVSLKTKTQKRTNDKPNRKATWGASVVITLLLAGVLFAGMITADASDPHIRKLGARLSSAIERVCSLHYVNAIPSRIILYA